MKTGSKDLDSVFEYKNELTMIYGAAATGKTTIAKLAAIEQAKNNKKVVYIDTEKGFSIERFKQLAGKDYQKILDNLIIFRPESLREQKKLMKDIMQLVETGKIGLVIVDTIGSIYRVELKLDEKYANRTIAENIKVFRWMTSKGIPVIITNQVYSDFNNNIINVGGNMIKDACNCVIQLVKNPRTFKIETPLAKEFRFEIKDDGIYLIK